MIGILVDHAENGKEFDTRVIKGAYPLLLDPEKTVVTSYGQEFKLLKFGRMPGLLVIGANREVLYVHYGKSMKDIPTNAELFPVIGGSAPPPESTGPGEV